MFSKTLPLRWDKARVIEQQRGLELWPSFDALFKFYKAYTELAKNTTFAEAINMLSGQSRNDLESHDVVNVIFAIEDLRKMGNIGKRHTGQTSDIHYLKFDEFKWFATRAHTHLLKEISMLDEKPKKDSKPLEFTLHLDESGDLWREPKNKHCYSMMEAKERLNIVRTLVANQTSKFVPTQNLASGLGKNTAYIRSEIGKINKIAKSKFNAKLIENKQGSGYRIYPNIKVLTR